MVDNTFLKCAKYYTEGLGLRVFPCNGKVPATPHGCKDATTDSAQIAEWWGGGSTYNVAIATGSGLVVLDVDADHDAGKYGDETLADLERQYGPLPETWMCLTGGGGVHYYFRCNDPALTVAAGFAPGLDYRGAGGYVIAPPSIHPTTGRAYEWEASSTPKNVSLAPLPEWLHHLMLQGKPKQAKSKEAPGKVTEGRRNDEMFHLAASLRAKGLTVAEITAAMMEANKTRCDPPLSKREIEIICQSAGRYERGAVVATTGAVKPRDFSDAGNAEVFCREYREKVIYTDSRGWLIWNGKVWEANDHKAHQLAVDLSAAMLDEAQREYRDALHRKADAEATKAEGGEVEDEEKIKKAVKAGKDYLNHAQQLRNERRIKAMLELSRHFLAVAPAILDANPAELNTPKGIVDLTTGSIRPNDPVAYCTKITKCGPGTQGAEMWMDFLTTITVGDDKLSGYLQLTAGMALFGKVYEEGLILGYGGGRNGKSTYYNAQAAVMGDYAGEISIETLTTDRQDRGPELVELRGKRLVLAGELEEGKRLSVSTVKKITSTDRITAAAKYRQPETFTPSHTLVLHSNYLPRVGSNDDGTWRRLRPIEFKANIPEGTGIPNFADKLVEEAGPAILSWCIMGAMDFARNGYKLTTPDVVAIAAEEYRRREDWLENFLSERCILEPGAEVRAGQLYQAYKEWAEDAGDYVRRLTDFNAAMEKRGFTSKAPKNKKSWIGLRLDLQQRFSALG